MRRPPRNEPGVVNGFEGLFLPERPLFLCRHRLLRKILDNAFKKPKGPIAVMGMGPMGPVSRLLYSQLGSCLVYGYLGDQEAAPGQWHVSLLKETLRNLGPILR